MGVVGRVAGAVDDDDAAVGQPLVERDGRVAEDRQALAAEELQDRLADGRRAARARRRDPPRLRARAGSCRPRRPGPARSGRPGRPPGRPRSSRRPRSGTSRVRRRCRRRPAARGVAPRCRAGDSSIPAASALPRTRSTRRIASVSSAAPSAQRPPYECPNTSTGVRRTRPPTPRRPPRRPRTRARSRTAGRVARRPATAPVDRVDRERRAQHRPDDPERGVVGGRPVDEHERRPVAAREHGDRRAIARPDDRDGAAGVTDPVATRSGCPAGPPRCPSRRPSRSRRTRGARRTSAPAC